MDQIGLIPFDSQPTWTQIEGLDETVHANLWLRPILLNAVSEDGIDLIEIDVRLWFEKITRTEPTQIRTFCECWFCCDSTDATADVFAGLLRSFNTDTALFLHRTRSRGTGWSCSIDRPAVTSWLLDKAPSLAHLLDPLMLQE